MYIEFGVLSEEKKKDYGSIRDHKRAREVRLGDSIR